MGPETILQEFSQHLTNEGKVKTTIQSYTTDIRGFLEWLSEKQVDFQGQLTRFYVTSYREYLLDMHYTISTINKKVNSLSSFNQFLIHQGLCEELVVYPNKDKFKVASGSEAEVEVFSEKEAEQLLFYLEDRKKVSQRDRATILLLHYTGLRVSELVSLKLKDVDLLTRSLKVVGKGGKYREVPLKAEAAEAVKWYLGGERKESRFSGSDYLLLTQRSGRMDRDTVNKILKKLGCKLDLKIHPHKFRHSFCTSLLKKGVDLTTVAKLAGHASIQTTAQFYINTSRKDKQEAVDLL